MFRDRSYCTTLALTACALFPLASQTQTAQAQVAQTGAQSTLASPVAANTASSNDKGNSVAKFASGTGNLLYLGVGTLLPLLEDGPNGKEHALRTADSLLTSTFITTTLKGIVREKRPDSDARTSFPSGHATAAFAVATMQAHYHPKQALLWYGGASLIAYSRVKLNRHYTRDVVAGAAVGYLTSRWELSRPRGLILAPFIRSRQQGGGKGLSLGLSF